MANLDHCGDWVKVRVLGSGGFGQVSLWKNGRTSEKIAIKVCRHIQQINMKRWEQEVNIMKGLKHRGLVGYLEVPEPIKKKFVDNNVFLGMEYCEQGDLRRVLSSAENCCGLREHHVKELLMDIGSAIHYLHSKSIVHRDIKPENIVLKADERDKDKMSYKLIDLGYAKDLSEQSCMESFVGTLHYLAPEFYGVHSLRYTKTVDFWSFGLVAFECITGRRPFYPHLDAMRFLSDLRDKKKADDICTIDNDNETAHPSYSSNIPQPHYLDPVFASKMETWLKLMLKLDPNARGKCDGVYTWFEKLTQMLYEKVVQVYNTSSHDMITFDANEMTSVNGLKVLIQQKTDIELVDQTLLFENGEIPDPIKKVIVQCWPDDARHQRMLYLFSYQSEECAPECPIDERISQFRKDGKLSDDMELRKRQVKHLLSLCISTVTKIHMRCVDALKGWIAILSSVEKYKNNYLRCAEEQAQNYYMLRGQMHLHKSAVEFDLHAYRSLVTRRGLSYDSWYTQWNSYKEEVENWSKDFHDIEQILHARSGMLARSTSAESANETSNKHQQALRQRLTVAYQKYDEIRKQMRAGPSIPAIIPTGPELQKFIDVVVHPAVDVAKKIMTDISRKIVQLLSFHHQLLELNSQLPQVRQKIFGHVENLRKYQGQRQNSLWIMIDELKAESLKMQDSLNQLQIHEDPPDPSGPVTSGWIETVQNISSVLAEMQHETRVVEDLNWDFEIPGTPDLPDTTLPDQAPEQDDATAEHVPDDRPTVNGPGKVETAVESVQCVEPQLQLSEATSF